VDIRALGRERVIRFRPSLSTNTPYAARIAPLAGDDARIRGPASSPLSLGAISRRPAVRLQDENYGESTPIGQRRDRVIRHYEHHEWSTAHWISLPAFVILRKLLK